MRSIGNLLLAYAKLIGTLLYIDVNMTMVDPPLPRIKKPPGGRRQLKATLEPSICSPRPDSFTKCCAYALLQRPNLELMSCTRRCEYLWFHSAWKPHSLAYVADKPI